MATPTIAPTTWFDRLKNIPLMSATQEVLDHPKLQMESEKARIYVIDEHWNFKLQLNPDNGPIALARFLALYIALPFFASYGCYYNLAMGAVKLTASGVYLFRKEEDQAKEMAANAVQHVAFAVYDFTLGFFVTASILYIPVFPTVYAVAPDQVLRLHIYLTKKEDGVLTAKIYDFVIKILTKTPEPPPAPSESDEPQTPPPEPSPGHRRQTTMEWIQAVTPERVSKLFSLLRGLAEEDRSKK